MKYYKNKIDKNWILIIEEKFKSYDANVMTIYDMIKKSYYNLHTKEDLIQLLTPEKISSIGDQCTANDFNEAWGL